MDCRFFLSFVLDIKFVHVYFNYVGRALSSGLSKKKAKPWMQQRYSPSSRNVTVFGFCEADTLERDICWKSVGETYGYV